MFILKKLTSPKSSNNNNYNNNNNDNNNSSSTITTTITATNNETSTLDSSSLNIISKKKSKLSPYEYNKANYYHYYKKLENFGESSFRSRTCLLSQDDRNSGQNTFKLTEFNIESELLDTSVVSLWSQSYSNDSSKPVEAKYQLPLSPLSVISKFVVEYQDKVLVAKIKEKSKALEEYNDTIASGGQAFLGEKSDDGLFNFMIGNIPPNEKVTIKLTIVSEIGTHLNSLHYCLHRFMFPMYAFNFNYSLNVSLSEPIKDIKLDHYNPSIEYSNEKKQAKITFSTQDGIKQNIVAIVEPENSDKPQSLIEYNAVTKSYALALNFYPVFDNINLEDVYQKSEFIFVVDCSGSMAGESIGKAKRALEICIRSLHENNKFNIYSFGSSFNKVFEFSQHYDDESLSKASKYIDGLDADLGGTNLYNPIKDILSEESFDSNQYPRQVMILTDGAVSNRDKLIDYVGKEAKTTRLFTFGIGSGVDKDLVIGLSNSCKGYYEFIQNNSDMEEKVMKLLSIANEPTLSNISIDWGKLNVTQSPSRIRPIFNSERMMVYGILDKEIENLNELKEVKMYGDGPLGKELTFSLELDFNKATSNSTQIHTLAAFKQIQDLEEGERKYSKDHKDQIVKLGKQYGLVSKHTSYIVSAQSDGQVIEESMESVDILKSSKNTIQQSSLDSGDLCRASPRSSCRKEMKSKSSAKDSSISFSKKSSQSMSRSRNLSKRECERSSSSTVKDNGLISLIKLQKANGSFTLNSITQFKIDQSKIPQGLSNHQDIWATLLVIAKLYKDFANEKSQWERIVLKSLKWVKIQLTSLNLLESFDKFESLSKSLV